MSTSFLLRLVLSSLFLSSCATYYQSPKPTEDALISPAYPIDKLDFIAAEASPKEPLVLGGFEHIRAYNFNYAQWKKSLKERNMDGVYIHRQYEAVYEEERDAGPNVFDVIFMLTDSDYVYTPNYRVYTNYWNECDYQPFIYLSNIEKRNFLDRVRIEVQNPSGESHDYEMNINWQGQIEQLPSFKGSDIQSVLIQPWFFLYQRGEEWEDRKATNGNGWTFRRLTLSSRKLKINYKPLGWRYYVVKGDIDFELNLIFDANGRWYVGEGKANRKAMDIKRTELLGRVLQEEISMPNGAKYIYRYSYKRKEQVPEEWILRPAPIQPESKLTKEKAKVEIVKEGLYTPRSCIELFPQIEALKTTTK